MKHVHDEEVIEALREVEVPEPSPLFWEHLSQRVHDAVAAEPLPARSWFGHFNAIWGLGALAAVAVIVLAVVVTLRHGPPQPVPMVSVGHSLEVPNATSLPNDASWAVMDDLASQLDFDEASAAGLGVRPGAADDAVSQLSQDERRELVELLREELRGTKQL
jgi:hypothetical protein